MTKNQRCVIGVALLVAVVLLAAAAMEAAAAEVAPRRVQAQIMMATKYLQGMRYPVQAVPVVVDEVPESEGPLTTGGYTVDGLIVVPDWMAEDMAKGWPPDADETAVVLHELLHQVRATPGDAWQRFTLRHYLAEEGVVSAATDLLSPRYVASRWGARGGLHRMTVWEQYPACKRMVRLAVRRWVGPATPRRYRSAVLWLSRHRDIEVVASVAVDLAPDAAVQACTREAR